MCVCILQWGKCLLTWHVEILILILVGVFWPLSDIAGHNTTYDWDVQWKLLLQCSAEPDGGVAFWWSRLVCSITIIWDIHCNAEGVFITNILSFLKCFFFKGASGLGSCHGHYSFDTFSHRKSCLLRSIRFECITYLHYPPYEDRNLSLFLRGAKAGARSCDCVLEVVNRARMKNKQVYSLLVCLRNRQKKNPKNIFLIIVII